MTTKPTLQTARSDGYLVTHTDWNTNVLQEGRYAQEVAAGTNTDKIAIGSVAGVQGYFDNILVNGGMEIWQRGAGAFSASGAEFADRWDIFLSGGSTVSVSQAAATNPNSKYMASGTYTHAVGGQCLLYQKIENWQEYVGRNVTVTAILSSTNGTGCFIQIGDGVSAANTNNAVAGGAPTVCSVTYTVNLAATLLQISIVLNTASTTFTIDNIALYEGSITNPYYVATPPDQELLRCQRHYQKVTHSQRFRSSAANEFRDVGIIYPVRMMAAPTVTLSTTGTRNNIAAATVVDINPDAHRYELQATATTTDTFSIEDQFTLVSNLP